MIREQDRFLPIANVGRIMKENVPKHAKVIFSPAPSSETVFIDNAVGETIRVIDFHTYTPTITR